MKKFKWLLPMLLATSGIAAAQTLVLDPNANRLLINDHTPGPQLDLIIQKFTDREKYEVSRYAVMDTLTKPSFQKVSAGTYHVRAGRMAERMTLVIRNAEELPDGYQLEFNGKTIGWQEQSRQISSYLLNGEKLNATSSLPFGPDSLAVSLTDVQCKPISQVTIRFSYPAPELLYVDINPHPEADIADTTALRKFLHYFNKTSTVYSHRNAVPDSLVISENELYFGFKKAYYDGEIQRTGMMYRIGKGPWMGTRQDWSPYIYLNHLTGNWTWLADDRYQLHYTYGVHDGNYAFQIRHHWLSTWFHNSKTLLWLLTMVFYTKWWLAVLLIAIIIFFNFRKRLKKAKAQARKTNLELQAIQSQLNPHFVFNALGSLQGLINKNETEKANTYLTGFSKLLRNTLNNSDKELVPVSVELANIENYIRLEQLRFGFGYELVVSEMIQNAQIEVPSLLIQPIVENAIKHGISGLGNEGMLRISFDTDKADLVIRIRDNGAGFDKNTHPEGKGLGLTRERIKLLNRQRYRISMEIQTQNGTEVTLLFKDWL